MKVSKGTTLNCEHTLARSILSLPSSPPHPPRPLLSLIFPPSSFIKKNRRSLYPFWSLLCPPPPLIRILFPNAQSRTRTRVYASLLEHLAICAIAPSSTPLLHTHRAPAVLIFSPCSLSPFTHTLPSLAIQPTPALSIASSSNSPTLTTPTLASEDPDVDAEGTALAARVSTIPGVSTALRAYEQSKASSRVVKVMPQLFPERYSKM